MSEVPEAAPLSRRRPAAPLRMLGRGLGRRCPRCGAGHLFTRWFTMTERCHRCGYLFAREDGFFLGAFVINFGVTTLGLAVIMGVLIAELAGSGSHRALVAVAVAAGIEVIVLPIVFYPFSKTVWSAIDLAMHRGEDWAAPPVESTTASPGG